MRLILAFMLLTFVSSIGVAELAHVKDIYITDTGRWLNLSTPSDVWPNGDTVYVLDTDNHRIVEFFKGEPKRTMVGSVGPSGGMLFPRAFWLAEDNRFYIASGGNDVLIYDNGNYLYGLSVPGSDAYSFDRPSGIAVYNGSIYVADTGRGAIKIFGQRDRTYEDGIGLKGFSENQLLEPSGIYVRDGLIYIADWGNSRIQIFRTDGTHVRSLRGAYECSLNAPRGVAVNDQGFIFVSDTGNNRIVVFDKNWECVGRINGSEKLLLLNPIGIKTDGSNNVYVADSGNGRVRVFHYTPYYESKEEAAKKIGAAGSFHDSIARIESASMHLGVAFEDAGKNLLDNAKAEFSRGNFSNAYYNATLSSSETEKLNASLALRIQAEVLRIVLGDEGLLDQADQDAVRYGLNIGSGPLRADLSRIRAMLDSGRYADAAFNSTVTHTKVLEFKSSISGSSNDTAKTRDTLLLAISDSRRELDEVSISASQYNLSINSTEIKFNLDSARESCDSYDFESCRAVLSSAKGKLNDARLLVAAHIARVETARQGISAAYQELNKAYSAGYFFKPDLSKAEAALKDAEAIVSENPDAAVEKANAALSIIEESKASINRSNLLAIIGIGIAVVLLVALVVVYYVTRGKPRKRRGQ